MLSYTVQLYKNAYSGLSKNSWYLCIVMFINRSGTMVVPFMSIYCIQQLHFSIVQAGTIMALFGVGSVTGSFIGGKLTDKIGFYDLQVGALFSGGIFFLILGYQHTFWGLCCGTFILSLCNDSFRPANSTAVAHYSNDQNKTRSYSLNRLAVNLGWAVGGGLGGYVASINYHLLFWVDGFTNILAAIMLLTLMPRAKTPSVARQHQEPEARIPAYRDKGYLAFIFLSTLFGMCFFQFFIMQPVFFKIEWHFTERFIGFLMALNGILIVVIEMVLVHAMEGKRNGLLYISGGIFIGALGFASLNIFPPTAIAAIGIVILVTFSEILSMPFMNSFWISRTTNHNRGEYAALYSMSWSVAQVFAPFVGSEVIFLGGFSLLWWLLGAVSTASAGGYFFMYRVTDRAKQGRNSSDY